MRIELVVIGDEVLAGYTVNTNAASIGKELIKQGYKLARHSVLPDDEKILKEGLKEALQRCDLLITTGGLGPTLDDVTRKIAAELFDSAFVFNEEVAKDLEMRFGKDFPTIEDQATVPDKAEVMLNTVGTAPGLIFQKENKTLIMLPGVPYEMKEMLALNVIPYIKKNFPLPERSYRKVLHFFEVFEHHLDPILRELDKKYPDVQYSIYPSLGTVTVHMSTLSKTEEEAMKRLQEPFIALESQFATNCYLSESGGIEEAVHHTFIDNGWTLSIAESCTGGSVASRLTSLSGASKYFLGSIIAYADAIKTNVLGVPEKLIAEKGAVSEEVAAKMVEGALRMTGSDFAMAVTGVAGPTGGTKEKPVGTVWCAVCRKGEKPHTWKHKGRGTREMIIKRSTNSLLGNLLLYTKETSLL